jgi:hypothetical protein
MEKSLRDQNAFLIICGRGYVAPIAPRGILKNPGKRKGSSPDGRILLSGDLAGKNSKIPILIKKWPDVTFMMRKGDWFRYLPSEG